MNKPTPTIEAEALALAEPQRTRLVLKLLDSLERRPLKQSERVEKAWLAEANRRYQAYLSGDEEVIPAQEVFDELRAEDH